MKAVVFLGDSLERIREFPERPRRQAGFEIRRVQLGLDPADWKPMKNVGPGVREIRVRDAVGAFRIVYIANFADAVYVLHAFQKKTQATARRVGACGSQALPLEIGKENEAQNQTAALQQCLGCA